jgi:hypothetical protein
MHTELAEHVDLWWTLEFKRCLTSARVILLLGSLSSNPRSSAASDSLTAGRSGSWTGAASRIRSYSSPVEEATYGTTVQW